MGLSNPVDEYWQHLGARIAIAGGMYPLLLVLTWALAATPYLLSYAMTEPGGLVAGLAIGSAYALFLAPFLFGAGFVWAGFFCMVATPLVAGTLRLLDERPPRDRVGVFTGSLIAFLATFPYWLFLGGRLTQGFHSGELLIGYGMLTLALVMGQLAGLSASAADARRRRRGRLRRRPFRLTIWRMLAAMIPLSIALTLLQLSELLTVPAALAMLAAGFTAYLANWPVAWFFHWRADRRRRTRRQKRQATGRST